MRSVENAECGKCGGWKMQSVENAECGKCGVWKVRSVENAWKVPKMRLCACAPLNAVMTFELEVARYTQVLETGIVEVLKDRSFFFLFLY